MSPPRPGGGGEAPGDSPSVVRVVIADDHEVVRLGIRGVLEARGFEVVAEAVDGIDAVDKAVAADPDIVILDLTMPRLGGLEAARRLRTLLPRAEILILSMHYSESIMREVLEAGIRGYMLKADAAEHLIHAVEAMAAHKPYFTAAISQRLLDAYLATPARDPATPGGASLTRREQEIVQLLAEGRSNKEIATLLNLSPKTVETHRGNLMRKLGLHGLGDLVRYAIRNKLVPS